MSERLPKINQLVTYMEGEVPFKPRRIKVSTLLIGSRFDHPQKNYWETRLDMKIPLFT